MGFQAVNKTYWNFPPKINEVKFRLIKAYEKITNVCQMPQMAYICVPKMRGLYAKVRIIYYIYVCRNEGSKKKDAIESLVRETAVSKAHSANFDIEIKRV